MKRETLEDIIGDFFPTATAVSLSIIGEPLLTPHMDYLIAAMQKYDVHLSLTTNGTLLHKNDMAKRIAPVLQYIEFSVDSLNKATFEHMRKGARFDTVMDSFRLLSDLRRQAGNRPFELGFSVTILKSNLSEICDMIRFVADNGGTFLRMCFGVIFHEANAADSILNEVEAYNRTYKEAARVAEERKIRISMPAPFLQDHEADKIEKGLCPFMYEALRINHEGRHTACLHAEPPAVNPYRSGRPGTVWNHPSIRELRKNYDGPEAHPSCRDCYIVHRGPSTYAKRRKQFLPYLNAKQGQESSSRQ